MNKNPAFKKAFAKKMAEIEEKVNARSLRERSLLFTAFILVIFMLWKNFIFSYLSDSSEAMANSKTRILNQILLVENQIDVLSQAIGRDSTSSLSKKLKATTQKNMEVKQKINAYISGLVSPSKMVNVLKSLLTQEKHLKVLKMESLEAKSALPEKSDLDIYNKGILLELEGDYTETVGFLEKLESTENKILWDSLTYEVTQYPKARITIVVHTMGTGEALINV